MARPADGLPSDGIERRASASPAPSAAVRRSDLEGGARVLTDRVEGAASVCLAVWVGIGSRDEPAELAGAAHLLEHLLFKGTPRRSAAQVAIEVDAVGGDLNASTAEEYTVVVARAPAEEYETALAVLLDLVAEPALRAEDLDSERSVILEELAAAEDDPEDLVGVRLHESLFPGHPLGREVLGTAGSITSITRRELGEFFDRWYRCANLVVTGAGAVDHERLVDDVAARLVHRGGGHRPERGPVPDRVGAHVAAWRDLEQVQVALGWRAPGADHTSRHALALLNHILGVGPASRLFQQVRERFGLTYSIASSVTSYLGAGALSIGAATSPSNAAELLDRTLEVVDDVARHGITAEELQRARRSLRGSLLLGLEDASLRAARLGIATTLRDEVPTIEAHLARHDAVTVDDVAALAAQVLDTPPVLSVVGPAEAGKLVARIDDR